MKLTDIYSDKNLDTNKTVFSLEVFPPKEDDFDLKVCNLVSELQILEKTLKPALVSVTYGAGGSNRDKSLSLVKKLASDFNFSVMPHFTCVCSDRQFINTYLSEFQTLNIENILALRGDVPVDKISCVREFNYANELVEYIKQNTDLSVAVAGYPEGHIEAENLDYDINYLKLKVDAGASAIFTQLFFNNDYFFRYLDKLSAKNINIPVIAGILPVLSFKQLTRMVSMCGVNVPKNLYEKLEKFSDDNIATTEIGIEYATKQVSELIDFGVKGIHFYCLNKSYSVSSIIKNLF